MKYFTVLPVVPIMNQVLWPDGCITVPMPYNQTTRTVYERFNVFAVLQVRDLDSYDCYETGCVGRLDNLHMFEDSSENDSYKLTLTGIDRLRKVNLLTLGYDYPFALVEADSTHSKVPLFESHLKNTLLDEGLDRVITGEPCAVNVDTGPDILCTVAGLLPLRAAERQYILETTDYQQRTDFFKDWLKHPVRTQAILH